jgi:hypothetical protein
MAYAVFYHASGCLPDNPEPEYVAESIALCARFIEEFGADYERPEVSHDTYTLSISEWDAEPEPYEPAGDSNLTE